MKCPRNTSTLSASLCFLFTSSSVHGICFIPYGNSSSLLASWRCVALVVKDNVKLFIVCRNSRTLTDREHVTLIVEWSIVQPRHHWIRSSPPSHNVLGANYYYSLDLAREQVRVTVPRRVKKPRHSRDLRLRPPRPSHRTSTSTSAECELFFIRKVHQEDDERSYKPNNWEGEHFSFLNNRTYLGWWGRKNILYRGAKNAATQLIRLDRQ